MPTTKERKSVPLTTLEVTRIRKVFTEPAILAALMRRVGPDQQITSEAQLMHALVLTALNVLDEEADEERYRELAASEDDEDRAFRAASRARRGDR